MSTLEAEIRINNGPPVRGVLSVDVEKIDVTARFKSRPDFEWEYVDRQGHFHAWSLDKDHELPTLTRRTEHRDCANTEDHGEDCEGYDVTVYDCAICGERIEPKVITWAPTEREYAAGRMSWELKVEAALERDERVSVRVTAGSTDRFGIGVCLRVTQTVNDGIRVYPTSHIVGIGPLGRRKEVTGSGMTAYLISFLRARLDETERIASAAGWDHPVWSYDRETFTVSSDAYVVAARKDVGSPINDVDGEHIAANDPDQALRQVEAHRKILAEHDAAYESRRKHPDDLATSGWLLSTVRAINILAAVYSDHPDFRKEWAA